MSKPNTTGAIVAPIPFDDRVALVHEEIQRRKSEANPENATHFVARLWVSWLNRNVLSAEVAL
ncbi:MAG: hypothetical protein L3K52_13460 [Candidatus Thiothrix sulfatifontis]|nr:MAG: hypothetical protein L3K52_13460 [Candidatus Thiothrix sulfatifontis]